MASQPDPADTLADFWTRETDLIPAKVQIIRAFIVLVLQQAGVAEGGASVPQDSCAHTYICVS